MRALGPPVVTQKFKQLMGVHNAFPGFLFPLVTLFLVSLILATLDGVLARVWPQARIKRVLFDKNFRNQHPIYFVLNWGTTIILWVACYSAIYRFYIR